MADVTKRLFLRHLRGTPTSRVRHQVRGKLRREGPARVSLTAGSSSSYPTDWRPLLCCGAMPTVVLQFSLDREDAVDAFLAQYRVATRPWYLRWPFLVLLLGIGALSFVLLVRPVVDGRLSVATIFVPLVPVIVAMVYAQPRLLYRRMVVQLERGNPAFSLPTTVTVSATGIRASAANGETTVNWSQYPYYTETARVFALLASDRLGGMVQILPKRGLGDGYAEPLRALLAAHSRQLR